MITVHIGQVGCRVGYDIYESLFEHLKHPDDRDLMSHYFREVRSGVSLKWVSRSVWLDVEPTAVEECIQQSQQSRTWSLDESSTEYRDKGSGGNWARGYQHFSGEFQDSSIDCIRRELERVDVQTTLMMVHSVGGGAGSGVGTRVTEMVQDEVSAVVEASK